MKFVLSMFVGLSLVVAATCASANPGRDSILAALAVEAKKADPAFTGFSAERGQAFWTATHSGGKPETPSCTTCHGPDPTKTGQTRAGKAIEPMAVSGTPARFSDAENVAKWFQRNCNSVLGRDCTAIEKGDVITYLSSK